MRTLASVWTRLGGSASLAALNSRCPVRLAQNWCSHTRLARRLSGNRLQQQPLLRKRVEAATSLSSSRFPQQLWGVVDTVLPALALRMCLYNPCCQVQKGKLLFLVKCADTRKQVTQHVQQPGESVSGCAAICDQLMFELEEGAPWDWIKMRPWPWFALVSAFSQQISLIKQRGATM